MAAVPKKKRIKNPEYLQFVREHGCAICGQYANPHHLITRGAGGSDYMAIPLCDPHHIEIHRIGWMAFQEKHKIDLWQVCAKILQDWVVKHVH